MNKKLLALAVAAAVAAPAAYADGVELYGSADAAVATVSASLSADGSFPSTLALRGGVSKTAATSTLTALVSGGISGSRWGIKGAENIGDGLKAIFTLESPIQLNTGNVSSGAQSVSDGSSVANGGSSMNGQLFGRTAWVGLSDEQLGRIQFGRNYSPIYDIYTEYDPVQYATLFSPLGNSSTVGGGGGVTENARQDNSIKYLGKSGNINYTLMYKFGNYAGLSNAGSVTSGQLGYTGQNFAVQAAYTQSVDTIGLNSGGITAGSTVVAAGGAALLNTNAYLVAAKYKFNDALTGKISVQRYNYSNASDSVAAIGCSTSCTYSGGFTIASGSLVARTSLGTAGTSVFAIGGDYKLNDKLGLYLGYYTINYDAFARDLNSSSNNSAISENYASALLDYNLSKRTDIYAGGMQVTTNKTGSQGLNIIAVGMRTKF